MFKEAAKRVSHVSLSVTRGPADARRSADRGRLDGVFEMITSLKSGSVIALLFLQVGMLQMASADPTPERPPGLPPELVESCKGKEIGDRCALVFGGRPVEGFCGKGRTACRDVRGLRREEGAQSMCGADRGPRGAGPLHKVARESAAVSPGAVASR